MRLRLTPFEVHIDIEGKDRKDCIRKARAALEGVGFKPSDDAYWEQRDSRAIDGEDSGSPIYVPYDHETKETT